MLSDYLLPVTGGYLRPCPVGASELTPVPGGQHCASCQRLVHDFTKATAAEVAQARAASPDGRLCGRFSQPVPPVRFSRRLRWFVVALVLVVSRGLTAREALAQVRQSTAEKPSALNQPPNSNVVYGMVAEEMPSFQGGGTRELVQYIQKQIIWPTIAETGKLVVAEGRVYVSFIVGADGKVRDPRIVKGLHPLFDAEVLRVLRAMPNGKPGRQNGNPTTVSMTLPITFRLK